MSYHGICKKCGNNVRKWENVLDNFDLIASGNDFWEWSGKPQKPEKEFVWACMGEGCDCYGFYEADNQPEWVDNIETIGY